MIQANNLLLQINHMLTILYQKYEFENVLCLRWPTPVS